MRPDYGRAPKLSTTLFILLDFGNLSVTLEILGNRKVKLFAD